MAKLKPETELLKAASLIKTLRKNNGNLTKTAKELGTTTAALNYAKERPIVKTALQELALQELAKAGGTRSKIYKRLAEGLDAEKVIDIKEGTPITAVDYAQRHKTAMDSLKLIGDHEDKPQVVVNNAVIDKETSDAILEQIRLVSKQQAAKQVIDIT
jgi:hypothetical protein